MDRVLAIEPNDVETKAERALVELNWKADTRPLHRLIDSIRMTDSAALSNAGDAFGSFARWPSATPHLHETP